MLVDTEDCPCFYGSSCPTDYKHKDTSDHWQVIAKMFDCPECGWITAHYDHCKLGDKK